ncbi:Vps5 C terminal like-domain-containing protein [Hysterangium stoloniferum]|nr:Vps5 C terminal like-domain-containing protein [Hysterangium stoloniferum]
MDSFDDLLDSSRSTPILDNPFEDPFARPRSPDPWLTFSQQPAEEELQTPIAERESSLPQPELLSSASDSAVDPLDANTANEEDEEETSDVQPRRTVSDGLSSIHPSPVTSPLVATPTEPTVNLPTSPVAYKQPATPPSPEQPRPPSPPTASASPSTSTIPTPARSAISPPTSPKSPEDAKVAATAAVISPLERGSTNGQSYPTLALGGEIPGWQGSNQPRFGGQDEWEGTGGWGAHGDSGANGEGFINGPQKKYESDDDDDVPIGYKKNALVAAAASPPSTMNPQPMFTITVGDPQKVGDPVRPYITYTVSTRTSSPLYRQSSFSVLRRYSDFLWLYETLSLNHPGVIVPPVPEKQQYGRFEDTFIEQRRAALNRCIQKIVEHERLRNDADLKMFLESDSFVLDIKHRKAEIAHERGGLIASIGKSIIGSGFYETDEWFDNKKTYLDTLESQLRGLVKAIDLVTKQRNEVALSMAEFADNIAALSECDMSKPLSQTLGALADVQRKARELQDVQAREDVSTIMSTVDEYARLINSVRLAFSSRVRLYTSWQNADGDFRKTQQAYEKARRQGRIPSDRVAGSLADVADAERRAMEAKQEFENASKTIKSEMLRFEKERVEDFKSSLMAFLDGMVVRQKEIIRSWEVHQETLLKRLGNPTAKTPAVPVASG